MKSKSLPLLTVIAAIIVIWYVAAVWMNSPWQLDRYKKAEVDWTYLQLVTDTLNQTRPVLPGAHQVAEEIWKTTVLKNITSKRSLVFHAWITLSATLLGIVMKGTFESTIHILPSLL